MYPKPILVRNKTYPHSDVLGVVWRRRSISYFYASNPTVSCPLPILSVPTASPFHSQSHEACYQFKPYDTLFQFQPHDIPFRSQLHDACYQFKLHDARLLPSYLVSNTATFISAVPMKSACNLPPLCFPNIMAQPFSK